VRARQRCSPGTWARLRSNQLWTRDSPSEVRVTAKAATEEVAIRVVDLGAIAPGEPVEIEVRWLLTPAEGERSAGLLAKDRGNRLQKGSDPLRGPMLSIAYRR
jgi:hypothetical protein